MFTRLGPWCHDRRKLVLVLWIVGLLFVNAVAGAAGPNFGQDFNLPKFESTDGFDILKRDFPDQGSQRNGNIVFEADAGVTDPAVRKVMTNLLTTAASLDGVTSVRSPYTPAGTQQISFAGPTKGKIAFATVNLEDDISFEEASKVGTALDDALPHVNGLRVELGGQAFAKFHQPSSETIGLAFAIVILILAFGSVLAMGLPVGIALFGIGIGWGLVTLWSHVLSVPDFATFLGVMIGLGVGIDYALLIVTRYREQLHLGHDGRESTRIALDTAGRSVVFAGATVVISLLGMLLMGVSFVQGLGISAATTVAATVLASVTLLPALLGFAGEKIEQTRWRGLIAAGFLAIALLGVGLKLPPVAMVGIVIAIAVLIAGTWVPALKREVGHRPPRPRREMLAYRWSRIVQHHPWASALCATFVLLVLALPAIHLRLGFSDESNFAKDTTTRQAYDLLVRGFGKGFNGPLLLVTEVSDGTDLSSLSAVNKAVAADPEVLFASPAQLNDPKAPTSAVWYVVPKHGPQDIETTDLVNRLRGDVLDPFAQSNDLDVLVTGQVAANVDFSDLLGARLPLFFGAVLALSFLLLMIVFRSLLVPFKAVVMNLLSIAAAWGVTVALFQWAWLNDLTNIQAGPIEPWAPMMLFAVVFGLSMDYEVFLLSRIREEWHHTGDSRTSVADGLAVTAKVITAAAAIMVVVFGSFMLENDRTMKLMGTGLATAIFLDATIVRMLLVPATMELLGDKNWWLPGWLDRLLPNLDVEGHAEHVDLDFEPEIEEREPVLTGGD